MGISFIKSIKKSLPHPLREPVMKMTNSVHIENSDIKELKAEEYFFVAGGPEVENEPE